MHGQIELLVVSPIDIPMEEERTVPTGIVILDGRLEVFAETPTGPMTMRMVRQLRHWSHMARKIGYGTVLNYGRDANKCITV